MKDLILPLYTSWKGDEIHATASFNSAYQQEISSSTRNFVIVGGAILSSSIVLSILRKVVIDPTSNLTQTLKITMRVESVLHVAAEICRRFIL